MHTWTALCRCDWEEYFCTEEFVYHLDTYDLAKAAAHIQEQLGSAYTLIRLEREV